jgi:hypothetical protein
LLVLRSVVQLGLSNIRDRQWAIFKCSGLKGWGLEEGLDWLVTIINQSIDANISITATDNKKDTTLANTNNNVNTSDNSNNNNSAPVSDSPQQPSATPSNNNNSGSTDESPAQ